MSEQASPKKSPVKKIVFIIILIVGVFFGYKKISYSLSHETTDNAQVETQIIPILPRTSGYVKSLMVNDFDSVKSNQFLAEIDDAELQSQLVELQADSMQTLTDIDNAKAALENTVSMLDVNKGIIQLQKVKLDQAQNEYDRNKKLFADEAITQKQLDDSKFAYLIAQELHNNAQSDLKSAESKIPVMQTVINKCVSTLKVKGAKINEIKLKLTYTKIYSPISGKIGKKNITVGQFVQAGMPLFSIVNDSSYWITANFKENQIKNLFIGKQVELRIDAFPNEQVTGTIESISDATGAKFALLPPDNSSGNFVKVTQRVPVKISINNIEKYKSYLRAGLSVFVSTEIK